MMEEMDIFVLKAKWEGHKFLAEFALEFGPESQNTECIEAELNMIELFLADIESLTVNKK